MKGGGPGDVHNYFSSMGSPVEAFAVYSRILSDLEARIHLELEKPELAAKRLLRHLPSGMGFTFSYEFARSSDLTVHSLDEFVSGLKKVDVSSIMFHMERQDFERWLRFVVGDSDLADQITKITTKKMNGETLRKKILVATKKRIRQLKKIADGSSTSVKKGN
jgi:alpha-amylase